jgi:hypothetical protein
MDGQVGAFIYRFAHDMEHFLQSHLESLKDDLRSNDEHTRTTASNETEQVTDWLYPPPVPLSAEQQLQNAMQVASDPTGEGDGSLSWKHWPETVRGNRLNMARHSL